MRHITKLCWERALGKTDFRFVLFLFNFFSASILCYYITTIVLLFPLHHSHEEIGFEERKASMILSHIQKEQSLCRVMTLVPAWWLSCRASPNVDAAHPRPYTPLIWTSISHPCSSVQPPVLRACRVWPFSSIYLHSTVSRIVTCPALGAAASAGCRWPAVGRFRQHWLQ